MQANRTKKTTYLNNTLIIVTLVAGFFFGEGLSELSHTHNNLYGFALIVAGLGLIYAQNWLVMRRDAGKAVVVGPPAMPHESCVLELYIHRGAIVDADAKTVTPAQLPPDLRRGDPFALQATVSSAPGVDFGKLARIVRSFADDLDKTHHDRVSQAN